MAATTTFPISSAPSGKGAASIYRWCTFLLTFSIVFQKFAVPGTQGGVGISLLPLLLVSAWLLMTDRLRIDRASAVTGAVLFAMSAISVLMSSSPRLSVASYFLLLAVQAPLVLTMTQGTLHYRDLLRFMSGAGVVLGIVGVGQLVVQAQLGPGAAFWLDYHIPSAVALQGYNQLNPITWDATIFKSNGVFFSEPSYFSQFLAMCVLAELIVAARPLPLIVMGAGLLSTYSGTGLITLVLFLPFIMPRRALIPVVGAALMIGLAAWVAGSMFNLDALTSRVDEINDVGTSGYARFFSVFEFLRLVLFKDVPTFLFGRGPGTVTEFHVTRPYEVFAPTYAKVLYEYGTLGLVTYGAFLFNAVLRNGGALALPAVFTFLLLGGYLQDPAIVAWMLVIAGWRKLEA